MEAVLLMDFLNTGNKYEPEICNGFHHTLMMIYELKDTAILNIEDVDYHCSMWNMSRNDAVNRLNNS